MIWATTFTASSHSSGLVSRVLGLMWVSPLGRVVISSKPRKWQAPRISSSRSGWRSTRLPWVTATAETR